MRKVGLLILLMGMVLGYSNPVLAREGNEGHQGVGGIKAEKRGKAASDNRSQKARENSNAQWSAGATKGQDRAALRNQGRSHGNNYGTQARDHGKGQARKGIKNRNSN